MLFNSFSFILLFLPVTLTGFFILGQKGKFEAAKAWLICASFFFYGYWKPAYLPLLISSVVVNYSLGLLLAKTPREAHSKKPADLWSAV